MSQRMDEELIALARQLLEAAPASVEMPAGTGKTHLLAAAVAAAHAAGKRSLVLTHTNAGVDAIRRRLKSFGVPSAAARVDTLTSWAFALVGAYPEIAGVSVTDIPNWTDSDLYVEGATRVVRSLALREVHSISFDFMFVDEYQDCTTTQHAFVLALAEAVPRTVILGDRLQAIFGWAGPLIDWEGDVLPGFAALKLEPEPHRWKGHNEALGAWLLEVRPLLVTGQTFDFADHTVPGLTILTDTSPTALATVAHGFSDYTESVVLLDKWPLAVAGHASRLGGSYSVMEDISGNFMRSQINGDAAHDVMALPDDGDPLLARWFAQFAKACVIGLADVNGPVLSRLANSQSLQGLARDGIQTVVDALERLRENPTYAQLSSAAGVVRSLPALKVYRWEAWFDTLEAIAMTADNAELPIDNFGRIRERLRKQGRRSHTRVASRTLLVKGLEYDHVILANLNNLRDPRNLYVALSRARKSVTVIASNSRIMLRDD